MNKTSASPRVTTTVPVADLKDRKSEPQMGNIGRLLRSKKGHYEYIVEAQMEGNVRIRWINLDGSKTAYSYTRVIKLTQIGKEYEEIFREAK